MKAIILTNAPINSTEKKILEKTKIFKLALNHHASELNPDARIITDYVLSKICTKFPNDKIISVREKLRNYNKNVKYFDTDFKGATILSAIDFLIFSKYDEILIIGNNKVNGDDFCSLVNQEIEKLTGNARIYQYTNGNFKLPVRTTEDFCKM